MKHKKYERKIMRTWFSHTQHKGFSHWEINNLCASVCAYNPQEECYFCMAFSYKNKKDLGLEN